MAHVAEESTLGVVGFPCNIESFFQSRLVPVFGGSVGKHGYQLFGVVHLSAVNKLAEPPVLAAYAVYALVFKGERLSGHNFSEKLLAHFVFMGTKGTVYHKQVFFDFPDRQTHYALNVWAYILNCASVDRRHKKHVVSVVGKDTEKLFAVLQLLLHTQNASVIMAHYYHKRRKNHNAYADNEQNRLRAFHNIFGVLHNNVFGNDRNNVPAADAFNGSVGVHIHFPAVHKSCRTLLLTSESVSERLKLFIIVAVNINNVEDIVNAAAAVFVA